jgi:glutamate N-acetyltransferase/amino-acid N-acetyltransferase
VDGDTSTNDAVLLLAREPRAGESVDAATMDALTRAITDVSADLAGQIIEDGEGASRIAEIEVRGAASRRDARAVAREIARSSLVKTALAGGDPNWGRILSAAGVAGDAFSPESATLSLGEHVVFRAGEVCEFDADALARAFAARHVHIRLDLGRGSHEGRMRTTDLTHDYVEINSAYTT